LNKSLNYNFYSKTALLALKVDLGVVAESAAESTVYNYSSFSAYLSIIYTKYDETIPKNRQHKLILIIFLIFFL